MLHAPIHELGATQPRKRPPCGRRGGILLHWRQNGRVCCSTEQQEDTSRSHTERQERGTSLGRSTATVRCAGRGSAVRDLQPRQVRKATATPYPRSLCPERFGLGFIPLSRHKWHRCRVVLRFAFEVLEVHNIERCGGRAFSTVAFLLVWIVWQQRVVAARAASPTARSRKVCSEKAPRKRGPSGMVCSGYSLRHEPKGLRHQPTGCRENGSA